MKAVFCYASSMLPPGHFAAGYVITSAILKLAHPAIDHSEYQKLLLSGVIFSILPDLDLVIPFLKSKSLKFNGDVNHRNFVSHAPLLWLFFGLGIYLFAASPFFKYLGLLLWTGSWTHFILDSFEYGIMWLWPFNPKRFAFHFTEDNYSSTEKNTFLFYWKWLREVYSKNITFYLEMLSIAAAIVLLFK